MSTTSRGIRTPNLDDLVKPTSQMAAAAQDTDDAIGILVGLTRVERYAYTTPTVLQTGWQAAGAGIEFAPPPGWGIYRIVVVATANMYGLSDGDQVRAMVRRVTIGQTVAGRNTSSNAGQNRVVSSLLVSEGFSGTHRYVFRALNETASRGNISSVFMHLIATRKT